MTLAHILHKETVRQVDLEKERETHTDRQTDIQTETQ